MLTMFQFKSKFQIQRLSKLFNTDHNFKTNHNFLNFFRFNFSDSKQNKSPPKGRK